jgi:hypothetical protein
MHGSSTESRRNRLLAQGFESAQSQFPLDEPNLRAQGGHRAFMNTLDQKKLPAK